MSQFLCVTIRFLDPVPSFCGRRDGGEPEWPPSPLRLFQALVDAAASQWRESLFGEKARPFLEWLEALGQPEIVAPVHTVGIPFRIAVPNNDLDVWAGPVSRGNEPKKQPNELKTMKQVRPVRLCGDTLHYLFLLPDGRCNQFEVLQAAARHITHLGWGVDMAVGDASILPVEAAAKLFGTRWSPSSAGSVSLRVPKKGTLSDLIRKHIDFLNRISPEGFRPVPPLSAFSVVRYRRDTDPITRPCVIFKLLDENGDTYRHPHAKLVHLAGMVRHLAIDAMKRNPPRSIADHDAWVERFVAGHQNSADKAVDLPHQQLTFVPLPSIGHVHTDPGVRRVMIVAPIGSDDVLEHLARQLDGLQLRPEREGDLRGPVFLERARQDKIAYHYTRPSKRWTSFTPVILPGHDDHKPAKTRKLIEKALAQSGIDAPCEFDWSPFSHFPKSHSAHKYKRDESAPDGKRLLGYIRPDHLKDLTAVHLRITFEHEVPGPITIGAGRHCGFGLMAAVK